MDLDSTMTYSGSSPEDGAGNGSLLVSDKGNEPLHMSAFSAEMLKEEILGTERGEMPSRSVKIVELPVVSLIATGGTIAGVKQHDSEASYQAGLIAGQDLISALPSIKAKASWKVVQPYSIGSQDLELCHLVALRQEIIRAMRDEAVALVIVTHGTDTMEEALFFLHLTLPADCFNKPLLFTGAMLPSDHPEADGPRNLESTLDFGLKFVNQSQHVPFGLVMQGLYTPAAGVQKLSTCSLESFDGCYSVALSQYPLALLKKVESVMPARRSAQLIVGSPAWSEEHVQIDSVGVNGPLGQLRSIHAPLFDSMGPACEELLNAEVAVVYCVPGNGPLHQLRDLQLRKPMAVVVAAPGHGNIPARLVPTLELLLKKGVDVIRATRIPSGGVMPGGEFTSLDAYRMPALSTSGVFYETGDLTLNQIAMLARLNVLSRTMTPKPASSSF